MTSVPFKVFSPVPPIPCSNPTKQPAQVPPRRCSMPKKPEISTSDSARRLLSSLSSLSQTDGHKNPSNRTMEGNEDFGKNLDSSVTATSNGVGRKSLPLRRMAVGDSVELTPDSGVADVEDMPGLLEPVTVRVGGDTNDDNLLEEEQDENGVDDDDDDDDDDSDVDSSSSSSAGNHRQSIFFQVTRRMMQLYSTVISTPDDEFLANLEYIGSLMEGSSHSTLIAPRIVELGIIELCQHVCLQSLFHHELFDFGNSDSNEGINRLLVTAKLLEIVVNATDASLEACKRVLDINLYADLFEFLQLDMIDPAKIDFTNMHIQLVDSIITVLYNVIQVVTEARELYRDQKAVEVLQKFRMKTSDESHDSVSCIALILQAYVINENENQLLGSVQRSFAFLARELASSLRSVRHRSYNGYRATEILAAINKLAVNDDNKELIVSSGSLDCYAALLGTGCSTDEQFLAAQGIWTLALKCTEAVSDHSGCVEGLQSLLESSDNDGVRRQARGALETLGVGLSVPMTPVNFQRVAPALTMSSAAGGFNGTIFISYNHGSKATVMKLRDRLRAVGFVVWVDEDEMCESIADDIISGLNRATVVLSCMTQKYYESPYCKKEVIYAVEQHKEIIPLVLEHRYKPHGWLQFHVSDRMRYDFSRDDVFEDSFRKLVRAIRMIHSTASCNAAAVDHVDGQTVTATHQQPLQAPPGDHSMYLSLPENTVSLWSEAEIKNWMQTNGLQHLEEWFKDFTGELLLEYKLMRHELPETFAACMQHELDRGRFTTLDIVRLNTALKKL